jgi:hypothetical protein
MLTHIQTDIVEGTWEEVLRYADKFNGHRLRVLILPDSNQASANERLAALNAWLTLPRPTVTPLLDDSRAVIYAQDQDRG